MNSHPNHVCPDGTASNQPTKWKWPPTDYDPQPVISRYLAAGGSLTPKGRDGIIAECEDALCEQFDQPRAILLSSGTAALHTAFFAIGLEPGDELICPTVTFHATATPALHLGAKVVLVDVDPETGCIDPLAAAAAVTSRTRAIVTNAQWGHPVDQDAIRKLCDRHHLAWVEDISHAHGASWRGQQVGTWGDLACASLGAEKMLTGGMGGVLMGRRDDLMDRAVLFSHYLFRSKKDIRTPGFEDLGRTGYGLKLGVHPIAAVVILDQLKNHFDSWVGQRRDSLTRLRDGLSGLPGLVPPVIRPEVTSMGAWYGFKPWIDCEGLDIRRCDLVKALQAEGIEVDEPGSPSLHELPIFDPTRFPVGPWPKAPLDPGQYPAATRYNAGTLSIPTLTGHLDESRLQNTILAFQKMWNEIYTAALGE